MEKDCALSTSPRKLIVGEERGHPQRVKRVSRICQGLIALTPAPKRRIELAQRPGPGKRVTRRSDNRNRTTSQARDATELPYSVLPHH